MRWPRTLISFSHLLAAGLVLLAAVQPGGMAFGDELEDEFPPGLLAEYTAGGTTVRRVDSTIAFDWAELSPDSRLPAGPFTARWESELLVRQDGAHRLHVWVQGKVQVQLDGEDVLTGQRKEAGWLSSEAFEPGFGDHTLEVTFEKTEPAARLGLYWSSSTFPVEPVPAHLLFRDGGDEQLSRVRAGSDQFLAHRCAACHQTPGEESPLAAPSLVHTGGSLTAGWIVEKLLAPAELTHAQKAEKEATNPARMPDFGLTRDQAEAIAAYLTSTAKQPRIDSLPRPAADRKTKKTPTQAEEVRAGELLSRSLGCLACHQVNGLGMRNASDGGDLSTVGRKRTAGWLFTWLDRPQDLNSAHRMPVFKLTTTERRQLATYLASVKGDSQPVTEPAKDRLQDKTLIAEGRQLVQKFRCAACHQIEGMKFTATGLPGLAAFNAKAEQPGCLAEQADPATGRPAFGERLNVEALLAFLADRPAEAHPRSPSLAGQQLLERKNCLACHDRDQSAGMTSIAGKTARIDADLQQKTQGLIPPSLTAVGDKLKDSALAEAIQGAQKTVRLPWLLVRMPRFQHSETEQAALLAHLISHDRIPPHPPELDAPVSGKRPTTSRAAAIAAASTGKPASSEVLVAGHTLVGPRGLSCIACHEVGSYRPKNVALGTRGSNLLGLGQRMRPEFYLRWTRSPMRIVPGMEMPSYLKPVPGVLNGEIDTQLLASWQALNDPRFTVPTNPSNVEQFLTVTRGAEARIVRDVFTGEEGSSGGTIARAFAVGLENSHSFVFDLSRMSLAQWAVGDFARQRTVGKSWYWDLAGVHVARNLDDTPDLALMELPLRSEITPRILEPVFRWSTCGKLLEYRATADGVKLKYQLDFPAAGADGETTPMQSVIVTERFRPAPSGEAGRSGFERNISVANVPRGFAVVFRRPAATSVLGEAAVEQVGKDNSRIVLTESAQRPLLSLEPGDGPSPAFEIRLLYSCSLETTAPALKPQPVLKSEAEQITSLPGFTGTRLPLNASIMPTALDWRPDGTLIFTSLKGHVYLARDTDGDGLEDALTVFEEGLAAPYGILADGEDIIVAHKPELLRLKDTDGDGRADQREVLATGWGYNDNYHDWTTGIVRDDSGNLYIGLGSDYAQPKRPHEESRWRGKVLRVAPDGTITPIGHAFRYPTGLARNTRGQIFVTDNQGVQNTFNEFNLLREGTAYGVPARIEELRDAPQQPPAVQIPHPLTRSVNGVFFLKDQQQFPQLAGQAIGCEYDTRFLVRLSIQEVDGVTQGAAYTFSRPGSGAGGSNFNGPLSGAVSPSGAIYIGSIHDSGWLGGRNTGSIARLRRSGPLPAGIRELRATAAGFEVEFTTPVDPQRAVDVEAWSISGYTRKWEGAYSTPDSGRHSPELKQASISADNRTVQLTVTGLRPGHVYEVSCGKIGPDPGEALFPSTGHYTLHRIPQAD